MNLGRITLALDELMLRPDLAELVSQLRGAAPAWLTDQLDAAATEVTAGLDQYAATTGTTLDNVPVQNVPDWVRLGLLNTMLQWINGTADTCMCAPHPLRPQPIVAAAWKPGLVACTACAHLLALPRSSDADRRCDHCGYITTGIENDDGIYPVLVQLGVLTYSVGACKSCTFAMAAEETRAA